MIALATIVIKGVLIPYFLFRALQGVGVARERKPSSAYLSLIVTTLLIVLAFWVSRRMQASELFPMPILVAVGGSMVLSGLFMIVTRGKALTQIIGYLVLENGIYLFGVSLGVEQTATVELGVLLDVLVCVFITGILIHRINREFDSISTQQLDALRE
jgi:hydrogenase-4 component E